MRWIWQPMEICCHWKSEAILVLKSSTPQCKRIAPNSESLLYWANSGTMSQSWLVPGEHHLPFFVHLVVFRCAVLSSDGCKSVKSFVNFCFQSPFELSVLKCLKRFPQIILILLEAHTFHELIQFVWHIDSQLQVAAEFQGLSYFLTLGRVLVRSWFSKVFVFLDTIT